MGDGSYPRREELDEVLSMVLAEARAYLATLDDRPVLSDPDAAEAFRRDLPESGDGAVATLGRLLRDGIGATAATSGPRCFHFVIGGATPAALGADWWATLLDQIAYTWITSPLAVRLEQMCIDWLEDLFGLPPEWPGVLTTGATMANFVALATARQWWGEQHDVDVAEVGLGGLPDVPVFSSGYIHASAVKVLSMLGMGRASVRRLSRDTVGRLDLDALERALKELNGAPAIVIANAGEVNAGDFDPIEQMADLAEEHNAWLHVDGAFGLFARVTPKAAHLCAGVERADSVISDGHKWLNVPYDCGFAFVRDARLLAKAFSYTADYLPDPADPRPTLGGICAESSRRSRSFAVWATLQAYGRAGYREMVERHRALARRLAGRVDEAPELERLADVPLNIVCFRYNPGDLSPDRLDTLNRRLAEAILEDGRVYAGATVYDGVVALRPALVNWRTRAEDVDFFVDVVREVAGELSS